MEDYYEDILKKAQAGMKLSDKEIAEISGIEREEYDKAKSGHFDSKIVEKLAKTLNLNPRALKEIGSQSWTPKEIKLKGLQQFRSPFGFMSVNSYLVRDMKSNNCAIFDTGSDALPIIQVINKFKLTPKFLFLTHGHPDHVADLHRIRQEYKDIEILIGQGESPISGVKSIKPEGSHKLGSLNLELRSTPGHSNGAITYVITGLSQPIAIVGDAIFAGSMGGAPGSFESAKETIVSQILSLPENTIICPGHGPMTTVGEEKVHNPFFAI